MKVPPEKRSCDRWYLTQPVTFEVTVMAAGILTNRVADGVGVDVSAGGMGLVTGHPLREGEMLKLSFPVLDDEPRLPILAEVMWAAQQDDRFKSGLRFLV